MSSATLTGARPECMLTLRVEDIKDGEPNLAMVEVQLRDWSQ
ncbi:hypothetical protein [Streptomyces sp. NPDC019890]